MTRSVSLRSLRFLFLPVYLSACAAPPAEAPRSTIRDVSLAPCAQLDWPVDGPLSSGFGRRDGRPHEGIDLAVPDGTPVRAAAGGVVAYAGDRLRGYGRLVIVAHAGGLSTVYAHNSRLLVREGEPVARGRVVALSGHSGHVTAPHVHFEVRRDARPEDPLKYLPRKREVAWTIESEN
jgi:murein DD-endopeptidase MepM/ murein hydrolase activator NlpD